MVNRTRTNTEPGHANIKTMRSFNDYLADFIVNDDDEVLKTRLSHEAKAHKMDSMNSLREEYGLDKNPLLLLYVVDKDSKADTKKRFDLNLPCDAVGLDIMVPGQRLGRNKVTAVAPKLRVAAED